MLLLRLLTPIRPAADPVLGGLYLLLPLAFLLAWPACGGDGSSFSGEPTGRIVFISTRDGNEEIYVMNADGSGQTNLSNHERRDSEASWSPDGTLIAFKSSRGGPPNIFVMKPDGTDVTQITDTLAVDGGPHWSPDGSRIAFYSFRGQARGLLWVMNADGSEPLPLLESVTPGFPDTTCAGGFPYGWLDSDRVLYRGSQGGIHALQICSVKLDGSEVTAILSEEDVLNDHPALSPDGSKIAFTSSRDDLSQIHLMDADGSDVTAVIDSEARDGQPVWSPDGQWIAFVSDQDGDLDIYIVRPDGTDLRQLTLNDGNDGWPSWGP